MKEYFNPRLRRWVVTLPDGTSTYRYRHVMQEHLGRSLRRDEHVHHINGNQTDDRLENLQVLSATDHATLHTPERIAGHRAHRGDAWGPKGMVACVECGTDERPHMGHGQCSRCYFRNLARRKRGHQPRKAATILTYVCPGCGCEFQRSLHEGRAKYCSQSCSSRATATQAWAERIAGRVDAIGRRKAA